MKLLITLFLANCWLVSSGQNNSTPSLRITDTSVIYNGIEVGITKKKKVVSILGSEYSAHKLNRPLKGNRRHKYTILWYENFTVILSKKNRVTSLTLPKDAFDAKMDVVTRSDVEARFAELKKFRDVTDSIEYVLNGINIAFYFSDENVLNGIIVRLAQ